MRRLILPILVAGSLLAVSCMPQASLSPLYSDKDTYHDPRLERTWAVSDATWCEFIDTCRQMRWEFQASTDHGYLLTLTDEGVHTELYARLVPLNGQVFLDTTLKEMDGDNFPPIPIISLVHLVPAHLISHVSLEGDRLRLATFSAQWFAEQKNPGVAFMESGNDQRFIIAPTEELRRFISRHVNDEAAFPTKTELRPVQK
jgi:hypothetical protein